MKDRKYMKILVLIPPLVIAAAIFLFSSQPATESTELSDRVSRSILQMMEMTGVTERMDSAAVGRWCEILSTPVRKAAHITEFTALYLSMLPALYYWAPKYRYRVLAALFLTFLYACSDEFHQLYVPGRAGQFTDVLIDCAGGAVISLVWVLRRRKHTMKEGPDFSGPSEMI